MKLYPFLFLAAILVFSCEPTPNKSETAENTIPLSVEQPGTLSISTQPPPTPVYRSPYNLSKPDHTSRLSNKLVEISGLSLSPDGQSLIAVNDELGKIFYLDKNNGEIIRTVKFGKGRDYEGIEAVGNKIYVVENNGTIHKVSKLAKEDPNTKSFDTKLNSKYDVEGLAFDSNKNRLLLACKGKPGDGKELKGSRTIYAFDLNENKLIDDPVYVINRETIGKYFATDNISQKLVNLFVPEQGSSAFAPSGIAIHPETSDICIISSVGKLFIILNPDGKILHMEKLESAIFKQPEGICFDKNGTLYISTEGKGGKAKLYQFLQN